MTVKHNLLIKMSEQDELEVSTTNDNEELELESNLDDTDDIDALREQLEQAREAKRQILARAKNAEAKLKSMSSQTTQSQPKPSQPINNILTTEDVEVRILKAQKASDDEIVMLKKIAAVNGTSIIEAQSDEMFISFKERKEEQEKADKAKLGASRGSGSVKKEKDVSSAGLSDAEHKELWRQSMGK